MFINYYKHIILLNHFYHEDKCKILKIAKKLIIFLFVKASSKIAK